MTSTRYRLIETYERDACFNMGLDAVLLEDPQAQPTLRFYTWKPDALSLGYFQKPEDVPNKKYATEVVKRMTGGGAIHHTAELTFSLVTSQRDPIYRGEVSISYVRVHECLARALAHFGVQAELRGERPVDSDLLGTGMCFHKSTRLDLCWNAAKGVGSAQRRKLGRVLHHGSIKLGSSPLEGHIAVLGENVQPEELAQVFKQQLAKDFALSFDGPELSEREQQLAMDRGAAFSILK